MKLNINKILISLTFLGLLAACQKPEQDVVEKKALKVISSDVIIGVEGGTGTIVVEADEAVTATSERDWCQVSVDGKTIHVTVPEANPSKMSRYARIIIKAGSDESHVTVQQYGEVFSGLEMEDLEVLPEGTTVRYSFKSNMAVKMESDQPWVHIDMDEEAGVVTLTVDEHKDFGFRVATVTCTAGSNTRSIKVSQQPPFGEITGWSAAVTDGEFVFPNQTDVITVTPPEEMASVTYAWDVASEFYGDGFDNVPDAIKHWAFRAKEYPSFFIFDKGVSSKTKKNLPSTVTIAIICFDDQKYPTGQYALVEVPVPGRGPVRQAVDGWDIAHTDGSWAYPTQTDVFTVTPKAGYEDVKYVASVVQKNAVSNIEDYAFTTFAMQARESILAKVASGELASFEDGLSTGVSTVSAENVAGDAYVVVVAFGDNQFYTGDYKAFEVSVPDLEPTMYRWVGKWKVARKSEFDTWEISVKETDKTLRIVGLESFTDLTKFDVEATADENGCLIVKTQYTGEYDDDSYGHVNMLLSGQYDDTAAGKTYYTATQNLTIFSGTLSEDGNSAELEPGLVNGYPFKNVQFYGRYKNSSGGTSAFSYNAGATQLPQTITRITE